jgi:hypothetical protein
MAHCKLLSQHDCRSEGRKSNPTPLKYEARVCLGVEPFGILNWPASSAEVDKALGPPTTGLTADCLCMTSCARHSCLNLSSKTAADCYSAMKVYFNVTSLHLCAVNSMFSKNSNYSTASLIRTNWDSRMFGLVNFRINRVLHNTRREGGGIGHSRDDSKVVQTKLQRK